MELVPRHLAPQVESALMDTPVVTIHGARQTGKSTLVQQLAEGRDATMFTLDDDEVKTAALADPRAFLTSAGEGLLILDEIQRAPELIVPIKAAVDRDRRPGRFLLTGSADLLRVPGAADSLAGRAETLRLRPMSMGELHRVPDDFVTAILSTPAEAWSGWETPTSREAIIGGILAGGLPTARERTGRRRSAWLDDYVHRITHRDTRALTGSSPARLLTTCRLLAANQSGELVKARVARGVGVSESVLADYIETLLGVFLIEHVPAWSRSAHARITRKPKTILVDSALCARLQEVGEADLVDPLGMNTLGPLLEGFVASELLKQQSWSATEFMLSHYRESNGAEVDLVVSLPGGRAIGIEVKSTTTPTAQHFSGLRALARRLDGRLAAGVVLHTGTRAFSFGDTMLALPVAALWENCPRIAG